MPRRRSEKGYAMNSQGVELRAVRLELPLELHRELRIEAAKQDKSMSALAQIAIEEYLARKRKGGGK
jgi:hypothetical protein